MDDIREQIHEEAQETNFSGVISVHLRGQVYKAAFGYRDRANQAPNTTETRFGIASGTKGFTALGIASLIEEGKIEMKSSASDLVGDRFPELHPDITIEHLLAHTSGVGDHYDEDEMEGSIDDFVLSIPVQDLVSPFDYLPLLRDRPQKFEPGEKSSYSNAGYVILAMVIESVSGQSFQQYIENRIFRHVGMGSSGFYRADDLPENTALGYLVERGENKTNIYNLPIVGSGDGGAYCNLDDLKLFWQNLLDFKIVKKSSLLPMIRERNRIDKTGSGLGFWIEDEGNFIALEGYDAGVSFYSSASRDSEISYTVISNDRSGAWPLLKIIKRVLLQRGASHNAGKSTS